MNVNNLKKDTVYVLNKNEGVLAVFDKNDEDTLIDPRIEEIQNSESKLIFQVSALSEKWKSTYNPENLYLINNKVFSANFTDSIERERTDENEDLITVIAYERQKLLEREYVKAWNSETGFDNIDDFMVVILSGGNLQLKNNGQIVSPTYTKGSSGYALEGLLYNTDWSVGTCDVQGTYDLETDQETIYSNILKIQEIWGGILVFDSLNKIVHHRNETVFLPYSGYEVRYQKNLQSSKYIGDNKIITELCPLGEGGLNIKSVNNNSLWLKDYTYTNSSLKAIENNDDIYEPDKLKSWGQRKLQELCKPRRELTMTTALLKNVEGYENEEVHLNDIVDVIDFEFVEDRVTQLRVIEYKYYLWSGADADLVIGDITLESTDIFKKNIQATNLINNGTLDTSKVIDYYKNGQSLRKILRQVDQTIIDTKSELTQTDEEIAARVEQTETNIDTLNNDIVSQNQIISELIINVEGISTKVSNLIDITETITSHNGKLLIDDAIEGYLLGLSIHGYDGSFIATYISEETYIGEDLYLLDNEIVINVNTDNICPTLNEQWGVLEYSNDKPFKIITRGYTEINPDFSAFFSIKGYENFVITSILFYDKDKNYLCNYSGYYSNKMDVGLSNAEIIFPVNTKYVRLLLQKQDNSGNFIPFDEYDIIEIKPMLEYVVSYKDNDTYSGILPSNFIELNSVLNNGYYYIGTNFTALVKATNTTEFEIEYEQYENNKESEAIIGTNDNKFILYLKTNGNTSQHPYKDKKFVYNGTVYDINTQNTYLNIKTTVSFKFDENNNNYILKFEDINDNIETFIIPVTTEFETENKIGIFSNASTNTTSNLKLYNLKIWENTELVVNLIPALKKNNSRIGLYNILTNLFISWGDYYGLYSGGIKYFIKPHNNFVECNTQRIVFLIDDELRELDVYDSETETTINIYDEFQILDNRATLIRRIGVDGQGNKYILTNPTYEDYGKVNIPIKKGDNYIEIERYTPTIIAEYVKQNDFTENFATTYYVESSITQLSNSIQLLVREKVGQDELRAALTILKNEIDLEVSQKIGEDEIIAKINLAVQDEQGIINIIGNQIIIDSDYFHLSADGEITATAGHIAGFDMWTDTDSSGIRSWLTRDFLQSGNSYRSGIVTRNDYYSDFIFAGMPLPFQTTANAAFRLIHDGTVYCTRINMNGESGYTKVTFDSGRTAMALTATTLDFRIDNERNSLFARFERKTEGFYLYLQDAPKYTLYDNLHSRGLYTADTRSGNVPYHYFTGEMWVDRDLDGNFVQVAQSGDWSDERLKKDIRDSNANALEIIDNIKFKQFTWNETAPKAGTHVDIGIIAQDIEKMNKNYVETTSRIYKDEKQELLSIDVLNLLTTTAKAVQELNQKVKDLEEEIKKLKGEK